MSDHYDPNHAFRHAEIHSAHVYEHQRRGGLHHNPFNSKEEKIKLGWNLGLATGIGVSIITGVAAGPLIAPIGLGCAILGACIGHDTYKDK